VTEFDIERWMLMRRLGLENQIFCWLQKLAQSSLILATNLPTESRG
jgi:hypothetical protein